MAYKIITELLQPWKGLKICIIFKYTDVRSM